MSNEVVSTNLSLQCPEALLQRASDIARRRFASRSAVLREAIAAGLDQLERASTAPAVYMDAGASR